MSFIDTATDIQVREQLLKIAHDLPHLVNAQSKPDSIVLAEAKDKLRAIEDFAGGEQQPFRQITAAELAAGRFALTYMIDGVPVKDQLAGLTVPKKALKMNLAVDLARHDGHAIAHHQDYNRESPELALAKIVAHSLGVSVTCRI